MADNEEIADKKSKKEKKAKKNKKGGPGKVIAGFIVILILLAAIFVALVKLDLFGLGTEIIGPKIQNIPVINMILPEMPAETTTSGTDSGDYSFDTVEQAVERLKATEVLLKEKEQEAETLNSDITQLQAEVDRLKVFEANQVQFEADKAAFDQLVAEQAGPEAFMTYVESIYPDEALKIYESVVTEKQYSDSVAEVASMYQAMKPAKAAAILEETSTTDMDMVAQILFQLEPAQAGDILAAMTPSVADKISRYMYPEQ